MSQADVAAIVAKLSGVNVTGRVTDLGVPRQLPPVPVATVSTSNNVSGRVV